MAANMSPLLADISTAISKHLTQLDRSQPILRLPLGAPAGKEKHETYLSFSQRKFTAAAYHYANVQRFLSEDKAEAQVLASNISDAFRSGQLPGGTIRRISATATRAAEHYTFELSAFLGALKSSVDMLAEAASLCIPGLSTHFSVTPLIRSARQQPHHPVAEVVAKHANWIADLRSYRDHLVHRLILTLHSGSTAVGIDARTTGTGHPVVLPERPPRYLPDTRATRARAALGPDGPIGLALGEGSATIRRADGTEEVLFIDVSALPAPGYSTIEAFMDRHLHSFASYIAELPPALREAAFAP